MSKLHEELYRLDNAVNQVYIATIVVVSGLPHVYDATIRAYWPSFYRRELIPQAKKQYHAAMKELKAVSKGMTPSEAVLLEFIYYFSIFVL